MANIRPLSGSPRSPLGTGPAASSDASALPRAVSTPKPPNVFCPETVDVLGKYHLIAMLARGGMADVYLAVVRGLVGFSKLLVVKELRHEPTDEETFVGMFMDEARLAARLNHPNVVQTVEVGEEGARRFIAMEYLDGQPLNRVLARAKKRGAPMAAAMHLRVIADVLTALSYAHTLTDFDGTELGIVHRDVSPHNVFVTYDGIVKLIDFGVAKTRLASQQTLSGVLKGKLRYMAPEQTTGRNVDHRADIFATGVMLFEAAAGHGPWAGGEDITILRSLMSGSIPRLRVAHPNVDPALAAIVDRATSPDPRSRYQDALAMRDELEAYLDAQGPGAHAAPARSGRDLSAFVSALYVDDRKQLQALVQSQLHLLSQAPVEDGEVEPGAATGTRFRDSASVAWRAERAASSPPSGKVASEDVDDDAWSDASPLLEEEAPVSGVTPSAHRLPEVEDEAEDEPIASPFVIPASLAADAIEAEKRARLLWQAARARRQWQWLLGAALVAILGSAVAVLWKIATPANESREAAAVVAPVAAMVGREAPAASDLPSTPVHLLPARMELVVRVSPPFARVTIDDQGVTNPFNGTYPRDGAVHRVEARAPGFETRGEDVAFDRDTTVTLTLNRHVPPPVAPRAAPASASAADGKGHGGSSPGTDPAPGRVPAHPIETEDPYEAVPSLSRRF